jgi:hypothetical protein
MAQRPVRPLSWRGPGSPRAYRQGYELEGAQNHQWRGTASPDGRLTPELFRWTELTVHPVRPGTSLVQNLLCSFDPTHGPTPTEEGGRERRSRKACRAGQVVREPFGEAPQ